jgi:hypothetical protein
MNPSFVSMQQQQALQTQAHQNAYLTGSPTMVGLNGVHNAIRSNIERNAVSSMSTNNARASDTARGPSIRPATYVQPLIWAVPAAVTGPREGGGQAARADDSLSARVSRALAGCCNPFAANKG